MYHSIILELLCDLVALAKSSGAPVPLRARLTFSQEW